MPQPPYRFEIDESVPLTEAEMSLQLAMIALEGIYGQAGVRLDARYDVDDAGRALLVDASTEVGAALVRVFTTLMIREFGDDSFTVHRGGTDAMHPAAPATVAAASGSAVAAA